MSFPASSDTLRIFLRDCKVDLRVGIYDAEMHGAQPVIINIELEAIPPQHYDDLAQKKLTHVISYEWLYKFISEELPKRGHIPLLESVAEHVITFCFSDPRVLSAHVRIEKTKIFPDVAGAGIEIVRIRKNNS